MSRVPVRTCVGCRIRAPKAELLRIVRRPDGSVSPDPTGAAPGRGAYVHRDANCVRLATARGALGRALRVALSSRDLATLTDEIDKELH
jgi:predicted RNA-binding protein YlxR (DUF448 family)